MCARRQGMQVGFVKVFLRSAVVGAALLLGAGVAALAAGERQSVLHEGVAAVQIADDFERGHSTTHYFISDQRTGEQLELLLDEEQARIVRPGQRLQVRGWRLDGAIAVDPGKSSVLVMDEPIAAVPMAARRVLALIVDITDGGGELHSIAAACDGSEQLMADNLFGSQSGKLNTDGCFQDGSFAALGFGGSGYPGSALDVVRVSIADPALSLSGACSWSQWASAADLAAATRGVDMSAYQHRLYLLPQDVGCSWAGLAYVGCGAACQAWVKAYSSGVCGIPDAIAHELGHNVGLMHARTDDNNDGVSDCEYCDTSDVMGYATNFWRTFNAPHKYWMGWLSGTRTTDGSSGGTFTLSALELPIAPYPQAVRIEPAAGNAYYVGYRVSIGYDASLAAYTSHLEKVQVHRMDAQGYSYLVGELGDGGNSWTPPRA